MATKLPDVGRIQGLEFKLGEPVQKSLCKLQYTGPEGESYELKIPIIDALYLLNLLRSIERSCGFAWQT